MHQPDNRRYLQDLIKGYRTTQVLISCAELGVFEHLKEEGSGAEDLAQLTGSNPAAMARLLNAAVALKLLGKQGDLYFAEDLAHDCLLPGAPRYMGNILKREGAFYRRWSHLTATVKSGKRPTINLHEENNTQWVHNFEMALLDTARFVGPLIAVGLAPYLPHQDTQIAKVIDVGGGHGGYSIALAETYPKLEALVFELPEAAAVALEVIAQSAVADRVKVRAGDFRKDELGTGFDMALLFGVLVSETPPNALALLQKVYSALKSGGVIVIRGFYLGPDKASPLEATLYDLHMLLSTEAGGAQTLDELIEWLQTVGFRSFETVSLPYPEQSDLLIAHKPFV
ncbi:MAG: methyltransferase domain-containing protein [Chloroflexi bacterium]|uniref:Acetylserotonin O-methyltransferase n=1 Tax=Candidatus Chlorohelix allophototropha TaxID=3003348 RepID=A0A8T7M337_9CHLR|nr:methyltransferase domain-containing protein [Chloroflexota bacterium]WJW67151.1 acetylserotonin O-methyltransferase [Chloroflexota bacterium L227-S17]